MLEFKCAFQFTSVYYTYLKVLLKLRTGVVVQYNIRKKTSSSPFDSKTYGLMHK